MKILLLLLSFNIFATNLPIENEYTFKYGNPFDECENDFYNGHPLKERQVDFKQYLLNSSCRPEALYVWVSDKRLKSLKKYFTKNQWPSLFNAPIYSSMWPVKTFYYGRNSLRIKLKKNVLFKNNYYDGCYTKNVSAKKLRQLERTVYYSLRNVSQLGMTYEFLICSPKVIESISFGQEEHLQEIYKDLAWSMNNKYREYGKNFSYIHGPKGHRSIVYNLRRYPFVRSLYLKHSQTPQVIDEHPVNQGVLLNHLNHIDRISLEKEGWIKFNPEIDEKRSHFEFEKKIYFQSY